MSLPDAVALGVPADAELLRTIARRVLHAPAGDRRGGGALIALTTEEAIRLSVLADVFEGRYVAA